MTELSILAFVIFIVVAIVSYFVIRAGGRRWLHRMQRRLEETGAHDDLERAQRLATLWRVGESVVAIAIASLTVLTLLGVWGIPLGPFIAAGSVVVIIEDQYSVGDVVELAGVSGTVEDIRLRTTVLRDLDGNVHHIPNGEITVASNTTSGFSRLVVDLGVAYREDVDHVIAVIADELERFSAEEDWSSAFPEDLNLESLWKRLEDGEYQEVILAVGSDVEGEATANYLAHSLESYSVKVTRLAQGLPAGGGLETADDLTLFRALEGRTRVGE